jgi:hypothetical protein
MQHPSPREGRNVISVHLRCVSHHVGSAKTTEVSIWHSGMVQYFLSSRSFSCGPTNL